MAPPRPKLLVVEDDARMRAYLRALLESHGYEVSIAETGAEAVREVATNKPEIVLLDLGLPDVDGLEVTRRLREWTDTPILVLSARGRERDKVEALDRGADDYLTKPFGSEELLARVRVALRHRARVPGESEPSVFVVGDLRVDLARREVFVGQAQIDLTPTEFTLLATFVRHAGRVLTHRQLLEEVWGKAYVRQTHYVRVYVAQLRRKIEADPAAPRYLLTETGVGYRLRDE